MTAAIYVRVSSDHQAKGVAGRYADEEDRKASLPTQIEACKDRARSMGLSVAEDRVYIDAHSGYDLYNRPQMTRLRKAMADREVSHLFIYALDRLARKQVHQGVIFAEAEHKGVTIVSVTEDLDNSSTGVFMRQVSGFVAEMEREKFVERSMRGRKDRIVQGYLPSNYPAPYGYAHSGEKKRFLCVKEDEAALVRSIFEQIASGMSLRKVAQSLNERGVAPRRTGKWNPSTIGKMIRNEVFIGVIFIGKSEFVFDAARGKKREVYLPREQWQRIPYEPPTIIDDALFAKANEVLNDADKFRPRNDKPQHSLLLDGYRQAVCGQCGCQMLRIQKQSYDVLADGTKKYTPRDVYRHNSAAADQHGCTHFTVAQSSVDPHVWELVVDLITKEDVLERELARYTTTDPTAFDRESLTSRIEALTTTHSKKAKTFALVGADLDDETRGVMLADLKDTATALEQAKAELVSLEAQYERWQQGQVNIEGIRDFAGRYAERLKGDVPLEVKRQAMTALGVQVQLFPQGHSPRFIVSLNLDGGVSFDDSSVSPLTTATTSRTRSRMGVMRSPGPSPTGTPTPDAPSCSPCSPPWTRASAAPSLARRTPPACNACSASRRRSSPSASP